MVANSFQYILGVIHNSLGIAIFFSHPFGVFLEHFDKLFVRTGECSNIAFQQRVLVVPSEQSKVGAIIYTIKLSVSCPSPSSALPEFRWRSSGHGR